MSPFRYPDQRHIRRLKPGPFRTSRSYKPYLREEFARRCVYCRLFDGMKGLDSFGVDHYRPTSKFPSHRNKYSNLFYVCNACNRRKGDFWPSAEQQAQGHYIPNPCDHRMSDHLFFQGGLVEALSPAGCFAVDLLQFNTEEDLLFRERMLRVIEHCWQALEETLNALTDIDACLATAEGKGRKGLERNRARLLKRLDLQRADLESYGAIAAVP